ARVDAHHPVGPGPVESVHLHPHLRFEQHCQRAVQPLVEDVAHPPRRPRALALVVVAMVDPGVAIAQRIRQPVATHDLQRDAEGETVELPTWFAHPPMTPPGGSTRGCSPSSSVARSWTR